MNILIIPSWYPDEKNPETGCFFRDQAKTLVDKGHAVTVLRISVDSIADCLKHGYIRKVKYINDEGIATYYISVCAFGTAHLGHLFYKLQERVAKRAIRCLQKRGICFDVIHAHSFRNGGYLACKCKRIVNCPVIVTEHLSTIENNKLTSIEQDNLKYTVNNADRFICVSDHLRTVVKEKTNTNKEIIVIPNMLSKLFYFDNTVLKYEKFTFIAAGALRAIKQYDLMIRAFSKAFNGKMGIQLLICGEGDERGNLEKIISNYNLNDFVFLIGHQSRSDLSEKMKRSHAFVQSSKSETFGVAQIEAMASGLPVIGTLNGGSNELLNTYGATAVAVGNVDEMASAMQQVYESYSKYDCGLIAKNAINKYGRFEIINAIESVYTSAIDDYDSKQ